MVSSRKDSEPALGGRWVRPAEGSESSGPFETLPRADQSSLERVLLGESRERLNRLATRARELEEHISLRLEESEKQRRALEEQAASERRALLARTEMEIRELRLREEKAGRADGFHEGFEKGAEEGRRLGFEQGRIEGQRDGRSSARREEQARLKRDASSALAALDHAGRILETARERAVAEAKADVAKLALAVATRIVHRVVEIDDDVIVRVIENVVDQIAVDSGVVIELHPDDLGTVSDLVDRRVDRAGLGDAELRAADDIERGGCRVLSSTTPVELTIESQIESIERAILQTLGRPSARGEPVSRALAAAVEEISGIDEVTH